MTVVIDASGLWAKPFSITIVTDRPFLKMVETLSG